MTQEIKIGGRRRAYINLTVTPTADGNFRVEGFATLRTLDPEVKRVYESGVPYARIVDDRIELVGNGCFGAQTGSIICPGSIEALQAAHSRLCDIERKVANYSPQELYVGGDQVPEHLEWLADQNSVEVVDATHADGSEYSWWVDPREGAMPDGENSVSPGDLLLVQHFDESASFVRCIRVRKVPTSSIINGEAPQCCVLRNLGRYMRVRGLDC
jgi:hypothetical protein